MKFEKKARSTVMGVSVYPEHLRKIDQLVERTGLTRSALVQQLIVKAHSDVFPETRESEATT